MLVDFLKIWCRVLCTVAVVVVTLGSIIFLKVAAAYTWFHKENCSVTAMASKDWEDWYQEEAHIHVKPILCSVNSPQWEVPTISFSFFFLRFFYLNFFFLSKKGKGPGEGRRWITIWKVGEGPVALGSHRYMNLMKIGIVLKQNHVFTNQNENIYL